MSATIISEAVVIAAASATTTESQAVTTAKLVGNVEVEFAKCDCCELTEECTLGYIERIRERYQGKWICGLCAEAVKDEIVRCGDSRLVSTDEALTRHMTFCKKFVSSGPPPDPTLHLISAMRRILRRSLESPRSLKSMPSSPTRIEIPSPLTRSESCIPALSLVNSSSCHIIEESNE